jgi:hypothetical protein
MLIKKHRLKKYRFQMLKVYFKKEYKHNKMKKNH